MDSKLRVIKEEEPAPSLWYKEGLRFQCTECGKCCSGSPGYVWVTEEEISSIANFLNVSKQEMMRRYVRQKQNRFSLIELPSQNFSCVFLKDNRCQIYPVRPKQCRTFPWWVQNLKTQESWELAAKTCEGINHQEAPVVPVEVIEGHLA